MKIFSSPYNIFVYYFFISSFTLYHHTIIVVGAAATTPPPQEKKQQTQRRVQFNCSNGCSNDPIESSNIVCGIDDITYANECIAICQNVIIQKYEPCYDSILKPNRRKLLSQLSSAQQKNGPSTVVTLSTMLRYNNEGFKFVGSSSINQLDNDVPQKSIPMYNNNNTYQSGNNSSSNDVEDMNKNKMGKKNNNNKIYHSLRITYEGYEYEGIVDMKLYTKYKDIIQTTGYDPTSTTNTITTTKKGPRGKNRKRRHRRQYKTRQLATTIEDGIIGHDNRTRIIDTTLYPYRTIGNIGYGKNCDGCCTGTVISKNAVLTAAHCVYNAYQQKFIYNKDITPGQTMIYNNITNENDILYEPFGRWDFESATILSSEYDNEQKWQWDYGIVTYRPNQQNQYIGDVVGTIGISEVLMNNTIEKGGDENNYNILNNNIFIGYPDDHFNVMMSSNTCIKGYWSPNNINLYPYEVRTDCDNVHGMSGSSILNIDNNNISTLSIKSHGIINYVYKNYFNGGVIFIHGGPRVPSILQWANITYMNSNNNNNNNNNKKKPFLKNNNNKKQSLSIKFNQSKTDIP